MNIIDITAEDVVLFKVFWPRWKIIHAECRLYPKISVGATAQMTVSQHRKTERWNPFPLSPPPSGLVCNMRIKEQSLRPNLTTVSPLEEQHTYYTGGITVYIEEYPSSELGPPTPSPRKRVCLRLSPLGLKGGRSNTANSDDGKESLALCILWGDR